MFKLESSKRLLHAYCKSPSDERHDLGKKWSITDTEISARSVEEIKNLSKFAKKKDVQTYGCVRKPIYIPFYISW